MVNNPPANAGDAGLILRSGRSPGEMATHSNTLAWEILWTEEPGELQRHRVGHAKRLNNNYGSERNQTGT